MKAAEYGLSPKTREVLDWLDARRRETERACYTGVRAADVGDSSVAHNGIDSTIAPADQLSPGSVGVSQSIEGIVR